MNNKICHLDNAIYKIKVTCYKQLFQSGNITTDKIVTQPIHTRCHPKLMWFTYCFVCGLVNTIVTALMVYHMNNQVAVTYLPLS